MSCPFRKLLCVAAIASAALAQQLSINAPIAGTIVQAGSAVTIQVHNPASTETTQTIGLALGIIPCNGPCQGDTQYLGDLVFAGSYNPQSANGYQFENITVTAPDHFNGPAQITTAHFYVDGPYSSPKLEFATSNIFIIGAEG